MKEPFLEGNALQDISVRRDDFDIARLDFEKIKKCLVPYKDDTMSLDVKGIYYLKCYPRHTLYA